MPPAFRTTTSRHRGARLCAPVAHHHRLVRNTTNLATQRQHLAEAGRSRLLAGVQYPSDVRAGLELGRKVAALVIECAKVDGAQLPTTLSNWAFTPVKNASA
jgi:hypothetical protein